MKNLLKPLRGLKEAVESFTGRQRSWESLEYFEESWKTRIVEMAGFISPGESVIDLGCGKMWLRPLLKNNKYYPVDYARRDEHTIVSNFNAHEYPEINADVAFMSGVLEYVEDYEWFVQQVCAHSPKCIVSYCTTEWFPDEKVRTRKAWKNHMSRSAVLELFTRNGMLLEAESTAVPQNSIFIFSRQQVEPVKAGPSNRE